METKVCTKCGEEKPATREFFHKQKDGRHGFRSDCKVCVRSRPRRWRVENKEKTAEYSKLYREQNKEKIAEYRKRYHEENREAQVENMKRHYEKNREEYIARSKRHIRSQPAAIYQIKNKETGKTYIGATTMFSHRRNSHKSDLRREKHVNQALQEDYNKYGLDVFEFEIIEEHPCDTDLKILEKIEEKTIKRLLTEGKELYNTVLYSTR